MSNKPTKQINNNDSKSFLSEQSKMLTRRCKQNKEEKKAKEKEKHNSKVIISDKNT